MVLFLNFSPMIIPPPKKEMGNLSINFMNAHAYWVNCPAIIDYLLITLFGPRLVFAHHLKLLGDRLPLNILAFR